MKILSISGFASMALLAFSVSLPVMAEKADRYERMKVEADRFRDDETATADVLVRVLEGNVVVDQGTMKITADRVKVIEFKDGLRTLEGVGTPVFYRQKREKRDEFIEVKADRVEFDERSNVVKLWSNGVGTMKVGSTESSARFVTYNTQTDHYEVSGAQPGKESGGGRVNVTIEPSLPRPDAAKKG